MNSKATDLNAVFGGLNGKSLIAVDTIKITPYQSEFTQCGSLMPPKREIDRLYPIPLTQRFSKQIRNAVTHASFK
ncbi:allophanate hydrolase, partial [Pseudoalteromonas sp. SIMBA_162]